ncbi:MAG: TetR/AcrR family transcriptional regulator [Coriobacteriia bacterium]|nr:TetR/AcrR family transcriptional regulator [Coriobacteriia bacterium]
MKEEAKEEKSGPSGPSGSLSSLSAQSKRKLFVALTQLMREKDYSNITISELSEKAGLDRRTFYRHFKSKDEILNLIIVEAFHKHIEALKGLSDMGAYEINKAYFELLTEYKDPLILFKKHDLLPIVQKRISEYLPLLYEMFPAKEAHENMSWALTYKAGGVWGVTERWIEGGAKETPEEMAQLVSLCAPHEHESLFSL